MQPHPGNYRQPIPYAGPGGGEVKGDEPSDFNTTPASGDSGSCSGFEGGIKPAHAPLGNLDLLDGPIPTFSDTLPQDRYTEDVFGHEEGNKVKYKTLTWW